MIDLARSATLSALSASPPRSLSPSVRRAQPADLAAVTRLINRAHAVEAFFVYGERVEPAEVAPDHQGRGLGRRLVAVAEALCAAVGCVDVELAVVNLRQELGPWYRSQGYREVGTAPYDQRPVKQPCHFVRMQKALA